MIKVIMSKHQRTKKEKHRHLEINKRLLSRLSLLVAVIVFVNTGVSGCGFGGLLNFVGGGQPSVEQPTSSARTNASTPNETPKPSAASSSRMEEPAKTVPTIEKQVIYEENGATITAMDIKRSGSGYVITLLIENNSSLNLGFNAHAYAVNGIMTKNNIYDMDCDLAAGKKANAQLEIKGSFLEYYGIESIGCVDALIWAYDNDKHFKGFDTGQVEIRTSLYDGSHSYLNGDTVYDSDGLRVGYLGHDGNKYYYGITNNTGSYQSFSFKDISVNDFANSELSHDLDLYNEYVLDKCSVLITLNISDKFLSENGISSVETIEWRMELEPNDDYLNKIKIGPIVHKLT